MFEKDQPDKETIMGERGKYGIYQTGNLDSLNVIKEDYHSLIKKYNHKYYNNVILKNKLKEKSNNLSEISKSLQQKTKELKILKPDSKEFQFKIDEINTLSNEIASNQNLLMLNGVFNSDEFKNEFNIYKNELDLAKGSLSKSEQKKLEKLSKERAELSKKQAELARKQAEIAKQQAEISRNLAQNNPWVISIDSNATKDASVRVSADKIKYNLTTKNSEVEGLKSMKVISDKSIKYYINGKLSTKEEMDKLNPNDIATVNVNKNVNNGKEEGEIRIQMK